jgi:hypothetical protein
MKEVKVFKAKKGGEFFLSFEKQNQSFVLRTIDEHLGIRELFRHIFPSTEASDKAILKIHNGTMPSVGMKLIHVPQTSAGHSDEKYNEWRGNMMRLFERKGTLHDPVIMKGAIKSRMRNITGMTSFSMNLKDYRNEDEKIEVSFSFQVVAKHSIYADYDTRFGGQDHPDHPVARDNDPVMICIPVDKFNYLSYDKGQLGFCSNKEVNRDHFNLPRQATKMSKIIRDLFMVYDARAVAHHSQLFHTYNLHNAEVYQDGNTSVFDNRMEGVSAKDIEYYLQKGMERLWELLISEFKPKEYTIRTTKNIDKIYGTPKADSGSGSLSNSCMAEHNRSSYSCARQANFYDNLSGVRIVYALDKNKHLLGRALLWDGFRRDKDKKSYTTKFTFLDRIYGSEDFISAVREWAAKKDYWWRLDQSAGSIVLTNKDDEQELYYKSAISKLGYGEVHRNIPYFDTLKYFNVLSKSKNYAILQLSSEEEKYSQRMSGTDAGILVVRCEHCGIILVKNLRTDAYYDGHNRKRACVHCSTVYGHSAYIKSEADVKLSFHSKGYRKMPALIQDGRLVSVKIDGKEVAFDTEDSQGIKNFFRSKAKKGKKAPSKRPYSYGSPTYTGRATFHDVPVEAQPEQPEEALEDLTL